MSRKTLIELHECNDFAQHEEIRRLNVQQGKNLATQGESLNRLTLAMFGNPDDAKDKGTKEKVDEMYDILVAGGVIRKTLAYTFGLIVAVVSAGYMMYKFYTDVNKK
jgi:hypothetical protein